ncbi:hypothetical protein M409DRAFT_24020 [Zasmidium cellare ATCC 36951]|uniref:SnoaL-like domain-containing protein n=1 Tax=Zasmidium cellare ATCC 36951 TaxID=1080233 RepID=A0A6A6CIE8_ZASCE|nr:uncharacterized protein M409DRAFT_24020 [Zasmidium cellare ATCC 36951]KAF2165732.1 hypothetical protein M409DRAFT_24020 [Zasmidium cellare ATCC 36951]
MAVQEPITPTSPASIEPSHPKTGSVHLLLETSNSSHSSAILKPTYTKKSPTAQLLETRSLSILRAFNARDVAAPYSLHSTPDFHFLHEDNRGHCTRLNKQQAMHWMRHTILKNIEHFAEVLGSAVEVDEKTGLGVVWIGMRIHDRPDGFMPGREKVTVFYWRNCRGYGGESRWMWWKQVCLSARMPFPR